MKEMFHRYLRPPCLALLAGLTVAAATKLPAHSWDGAQMAELQRLEQQTLGNNNFDMALDERLSLVETKVLGSRGSGPVKRRLLDIERKLNPAAYPDEPSQPSSADSSPPTDSVSKPGKNERGLKAVERPLPPSRARSAQERPQSGSAGGGLSVDAGGVTAKPMFDPPLSAP